MMDIESSPSAKKSEAGPKSGAKSRKARADDLNKILLKVEVARRNSHQGTRNWMVPSGLLGSGTSTGVPG